MDILRGLFVGAVQRGQTAVQSLLGRDRADALRRWFAATARDQPLLFGLVVTWLAFCAVPLAAFVGYVALWAVVAFSVFWAIFLFWSGIGLLFLVPALCVATGFSVVVFVWAATTYVVGARVLAAAGFDVPSVFGLGGSGASGSSNSNGNSNGNSSKGTSYGKVSSSWSSSYGKPSSQPDKPPSYALHPVSATKTFDPKEYSDFLSTGLDKPTPVESLQATPASTK
ncbi:hypothetical protein HMPREF1624_02281 [Sporothrix schenckii ATCC 58251]|uniref:Uncharacterized protein n=1 Tax=Sporothrix schenckii (strain ATCC 58251 / de Perez 2211183) TaxID=1391915 RepID=U7PZI3_SPOS1|nr:hypothetical protein HMPREF1624_02281 [Sporothrix schenckii ATCC 58251]